MVYWVGRKSGLLLDLGDAAWPERVGVVGRPFSAEKPTPALKNAHARIPDSMAAFVPSTGLYGI